MIECSRGPEDNDITCIEQITNFGHMWFEIPKRGFLLVLDRRMELSKLKSA